MDKVLSIKLEKMASKWRRKRSRRTRTHHKGISLQGTAYTLKGLMATYVKFFTVLSNSRKNSHTKPYNLVEARSMLSLCLGFL